MWGRLCVSETTPREPHVRGLARPPHTPKHAKLDPGRWVATGGEGSAPTQPLRVRAGCVGTRWAWGGEHGGGAGGSVALEHVYATCVGAAAGERSGAAAGWCVGRRSVATSSAREHRRRDCVRGCGLVSATWHVGDQGGGACGVGCVFPRPHQENHTSAGLRDRLTRRNTPSSTRGGGWRRGARPRLPHIDHARSRAVRRRSSGGGTVAAPAGRWHQRTWLRRVWVLRPECGRVLLVVCRSSFGRHVVST